MYKRKTTKRSAGKRKIIVKRRRTVRRGGASTSSQIKSLNQLYEGIENKIKEQLKKTPCTFEQINAIHGLIKIFIKNSTDILSPEQLKYFQFGHVPDEFKKLFETFLRNFNVQTSEMYKKLLKKCDKEVFDPIDYVIKEYEILTELINQHEMHNGPKVNCTYLLQMVRDFETLCDSYLKPEFELATNEKQIIEGLLANPTYHELTDNLNNNCLSHH